MPTNIEQLAITIPADFLEYSAMFFHPSAQASLSSCKCNVSLSEGVYLTIERTLSYLGNGESTMGGYVESILLSHLSQYKGILNKGTPKRSKQPLIPDSMGSK